MLSLVTGMEIPFFFVIVKVNIANVAAFSFCEISSSETIWVDASEVIIFCAGGEIKSFPFYRLRFCIHHGS